MYIVHSPLLDYQPSKEGKVDMKVRVVVELAAPPYCNGHKVHVSGSQKS